MPRPCQPAWVLLSASSDRSRFAPDPAERHAVLSDQVLLKARALNATAPSQLVQASLKVTNAVKPARTAVLLIGELRCLQRSGTLLADLGRCCDLFVVTTADFRQQALKLTEYDRTLIIDDVPEAAKRDQAFPVNAMKQWHKLSLALQLMRRHEARRGTLYRHVLKLRSDYYFAHPQSLLRGIRRCSQEPQTGLVGASDKVFGGRRDTMVLLEGLMAAIPGWFDRRERGYWPINLDQVLASDDAFKWYGMNWPVELIGRPQSTHAWRQLLSAGGPPLATALSQPITHSDTPLHSLLTGHERFASEICFARYLNFCGVPFRDCRGLRGFLYNDRTQQA